MASLDDRSLHTTPQRVVRFTDDIGQEQEGSPASLAPTPPPHPPLAYIAMREESALDEAARAEAAAITAKGARRDSTVRAAGLSFYRILFVVLIIVGLVGVGFIVYGIVTMGNRKTR